MWGYNLTDRLRLVLICGPNLWSTWPQLWKAMAQLLYILILCFFMHKHVWLSTASLLSIYSFGLCDIIIHLHSIQSKFTNYTKTISLVLFLKLYWILTLNIKHMWLSKASLLSIYSFGLCEIIKYINIIMFTPSKYWILTLNILKLIWWLINRLLE